MKIAVFNGSPRKDGNTSALVDTTLKEISARKMKAETMTLFDKNIAGCKNCGACQKKTLPGHCAVKDDMSAAFDLFLESDVIIIASPIYMWNFTPCTLAFLNRLHALCIHGKHNEMEGKKLAFLITMGAEPEVADYSINGMIDFAEYFGMEFIGAICAPFADRSKILAGEYAEDIAEMVGDF